jgi:hypothetical protein
LPESEYRVISELINSIAVFSGGEGPDGFFSYFFLLVVRERRVDAVGERFVY